MLCFYKYLSKFDKKLYGFKWELISKVFLNKDKESIEQITESKGYSISQGYIYYNEAIKELTGLIFGVDAVKLDKFKKKSI